MLDHFMLLCHVIFVISEVPEGPGGPEGPSSRTPFQHSYLKKQRSKGSDAHFIEKTINSMNYFT